MDLLIWRSKTWPILFLSASIAPPPASGLLLLPINFRHGIYLEYKNLNDILNYFVSQWTAAVLSKGQRSYHTQQWIADLGRTLFDHDGFGNVVYYLHGDAFIPYSLVFSEVPLSIITQYHFNDLKFLESFRLLGAQWNKNGAVPGIVSKTSALKLYPISMTYKKIVWRPISCWTTLDWSYNLLIPSNLFGRCFLILHVLRIHRRKQLK